MNESKIYFFTTLNCDVFPFSRTTLKIYIPTSRLEMLKSALPFTSEILLVAAIFPETSVTVKFATPSPSIEIVR